MVGQAAPVLSPRHAATLGALLVALVAWDAGAGRLPGLPNRLDVALTALVLIPATFWVARQLLPLRRARPGALAAGAVVLGLISLLLTFAGAGAAFNTAKVVALVLAGMWFLTLFEAVSWVVLVALLIPLVDIVSVYRGPTKVVVEQEPGLFDRISIGFRLPGEDAGARLGPPDVLFFALFLGAAQRFGLRVGWTWVSMTACLGLTLVATYGLELDGLPALPAIAIGFLAPNVDRWVPPVWAGLRRLASRRRAPND